MKAQAPLVWSLVQGPNNKFRSENLRFPNKVVHVITKLLNCILKHLPNIRQVELFFPREEHVADSLANKLKSENVRKGQRKNGPFGFWKSG